MDSTETIKVMKAAAELLKKFNLSQIKVGEVTLTAGTDFPAVGDSDGY